MAVVLFSDPSFLVNPNSTNLKGPSLIIAHRHRSQSRNIGTPLRLRYIPYSYMESLGKPSHPSGLRQAGRVHKLQDVSPANGPPLLHHRPATSKAAL